MNWCLLCKAAAVSVNHLLVHCLSARALWDLPFSCLGVSWVIFNSILDHLFAWEGSFGRIAKKKNAKLFPHTIFVAFGMKEISKSLRCADAASMF